MKRSIHGCFALEMDDKILTPPAPLVRGEKTASSPPAILREKSTANSLPTPAGEEKPTESPDALAPSPDKGRVGEGLKFLPYKKHLTALARQNRNNPTPAETLLWQKVLRGKQFGQHKFLRQKPIGPYIVDFYCAELHLVIEVDGDSHAEQATDDVQRTAYLNKLGLSVRRYTNRDVLNNLPGLYDHLLTPRETLTP